MTHLEFLTLTPTERLRLVESAASVLDQYRDAETAPYAVLRAAADLVAWASRPVVPA